MYEIRAVDGAKVIGERQTKSGAKKARTDVVVPIDETHATAATESEAREKLMAAAEARRPKGSFTIEVTSTGLLLRRETTKGRRGEPMLEAVLMRGQEQAQGEEPELLIEASER